MDYLWPCVLFVWAAYLWDTYLQWRQRRVYQTSKVVPEEAKEMFDQQTFDKSRVYQLDKSTFSMAHELYKQLEFLVILVVGAIPLAWSAAGWIIGYFGYGEDHEVKQSVAFLLISQTYSTLTGLPWTVYSTFVLEEKHGFNKQTPWFFVKDQVKYFLLQAVLNPSIMAGLVVVIKWGGEYFYIYAWLFVLVVSLILLFVYHDYIAPLFDKYTPLPEGALKMAIEKLAASLDFPLKKLLVVEGSKRSAHSNAYFYGFWKNKRIVLFDTLLGDDVKPTSKPEVGGAEDVPTESGDPDVGGAEDDVPTESGDPNVGGAEDVPKESGDPDEGVSSAEEKKKAKGCNMEEILAVLAHELGHWKLSHNLKNLAIGETNLLFTLFLFGYFMNQQDLYTSFGFPDSRPVLIGLILFLQLIFIPYNEVFSFLMTQLIRRYEYQADTFASDLGRGNDLCSALTKLHKDNLSFPIADPLYSAFHHSHPTFLERIRELRKKEKKTE